MFYALIISIVVVLILFYAIFKLSNVFLNRQVEKPDGVLIVEGACGSNDYKEIRNFMEFIETTDLDLYSVNGDVDEQPNK